METTLFPNDKHLHKIMHSDRAPMPGHNLEARLNYHFLLKHSSNKIHSNSFAGFLGWLISGKSIAIKTALGVVVAGFFMLKSPITTPYGKNSADTCRNSILLVDTNFLVKDTCR